MASPFAVFRKYQAVLLAVFGVLIIILFAIGDPLMQWASRRDEVDQDPVVATWSGGKITRNQLGAMIGVRSAAAAFLAEVQRRGKTEDRVNLLLSEDNLGPRETVISMLLADRAQEIGLTVSNDEINQYLDGLGGLGLGGPIVTRPEMRSIIEGRRHSVTGVYEPIRRELLARKLMSFVRNGLESMPPADQFQVYLRLNRRADVDLIAIPVDSFLDKVPDPSDKELAAYFAKHKETLPPLDEVGADVLDSPEPGFKLPYRANVEYFSANFSDFVDRARPKVTDEEIKKYYDEHKETDRDLWRQTFLSPHEVGTDKVPKLDADKEGKNEPAKDDAKETDKQPDNGKEKAADPMKPSAGPAGDAEPAPRESGSQEGAPKNATKPSATPSPTQDARHAAARAETRLAFAPAEKDKEEPAEKAPADQPAADTGAKTGAEPKPGAPPQESVPPTKEPAPATTEKPASAPPAAADKLDEKPSAPPAAGTGSKADREKAAAEARYRPLDEVKDQIRNRVAEQKASQDLFETFSTLEKRIDSYRTSMRDARDKPANRQPTPPDYDAIAKQHGLQFHRTGLVSRRAFMLQKEIGRSVTLTYPSQLLSAVLFSDSSESSLWRPEVAGAFEGVAQQRFPDLWYLVWKGAQAPEGVPELADVRTDVLKQFKRGAGAKDGDGTARSLALAAAKVLAAKAKAGTPLEELVKSQPGAKLVEPDQFTWLKALQSMVSALSGPAKLSEIDGVDEPGPAFMETVFSLAPGEVGVAMNHPRTVVYVVKVNSEPRKMEELRSDFLANMSTFDVQRDIYLVSQLDEQQLTRRFVEDIQKHYRLEWVIPNADEALR